MEYLILKAVHILAVIIFLGNITLGLFWKAHADRTKTPLIMQHTLDGIMRSDRLFTLPSIVAILIGGFGAAIRGGFPILGTGWIFWSIVLFSISGVIFSSQVAPLQRQLHDIALAGVKESSLDWDLYRKLSHRWELWGGIALITPLIAALLMIFKPVLPGL